MSAAPVAILVRNLSKVYRIYRNPVQALTETITGKPRHIRRVALDNVNLEVRRGEIVGVLGRNGAGKSTLLKLIAGTLERTEGHLDVRGRVTAILELGSGFHPDYTGSENIYMGGMCLGMSRKEVEAKLESIIEFSELRDVIDQPFKTYSTGMQARLTFSVAISVDPDILIVDEALSVGDARFQLKCFTRLQQLREKSTTILLVSHDTNTITALCDRALILEGGRVYAEGDSKKMSMAYHNLMFGEDRAATPRKGAKSSNGAPAGRNDELTVSNTDSGVRPALSAATVESAVQPPPDDATDGQPIMRYGSGEASLIEWGILDAEGQRCQIIESGKACRFYMVMDCLRDIDDLSCGFAIKDRRGTVLWGVTNLSQKQSAYKARAGSRLIIAADCIMWLAAGDYFLTLGAAHLADGAKIDFAEDAISFKVIGPDGIFTTSTVNLQTVFSIDSASGAVKRVARS
ncbi:MAG TPA: ABC transporter ATP-binding protein [Gammaproteobacteria bacterium]|nr:ABC transporter ATP-binding protein [Gammaproteobacteria bacterium]